MLLLNTSATSKTPIKIGTRTLLKDLLIDWFLGLKSESVYLSKWEWKDQDFCFRPCLLLLKPQGSINLFFFFSWPHHMQYLSSPEIRLAPPAVEMQSLHPWTAREVPIILILRKEIFSKVGKSKVYFCSDAQYLNKSSVSLCLCQDNWKSCKVLCIIYCLCIYYYYLDNWYCIYCNLSKC